MPTTICKVMGVIFIVVAIWGFIDGEKVLIFHVNAMHNIVHLFSGVVALTCGFLGPLPAHRFCIVFGSVYGLVAIAGLFEVRVVNELLHLNDADDFLHLGIAAAFLASATLPRLIRATPTPATNSR